MIRFVRYWLSEALWWLALNIDAGAYWLYRRLVIWALKVQG